MSTLTQNSMTNHHAPGLIHQIGETLHVWHERYRTRRELTNLVRARPSGRRTVLERCRLRGRQTLLAGLIGRQAGAA
ncbi:hypothetical protein ACVWZV_000590 [Bradyrhizobium sp. GM5.1]